MASEITTRHIRSTFVTLVGRQNVTYIESEVDSGSVEVGIELPAWPLPTLSVKMWCSG